MPRPKVDPRDFIRSELGRRRLLQSGLALGAGAVGSGLAAGCSDGGGQFTGEGNQGGGGGGGEDPGGGGGANVAPTPRHESVIVDQVEFEVFGSYNPFIPNGEQYQGGVGQCVREYLWYFNLATGEIIPWLATEWEYANDFREFTIHLNPKAHWNDGTPFTSKDIKFTMELLQSDETLLGRGIATEEAESIETPDEQTVVITLNTRDPRYHYEFVCGIVDSKIKVVPEHIWAGENATEFKNDPPVYTGPYKLNESIRDLSMYVWEKDPEYWNIDEFDPEPKYVVYRSVLTPDAAIQDAKKNVTDVSSATYDLFNAAIEEGFDNFMITPMLDPCTRAIWINCDPSKGILSKPEMRWAISSLIDREKIATSLWPVDTPVAMFPWAAYPGNAEWENESIAAEYPLTYDVAKAEQLIEEAGGEKAGDKWTYEGKPLSFEIITTSQDPGAEYLSGQLLAEQFKAIGIDASLKTLTGSVFDDRKKKGQFDLTTEWLCGELYDPWQVYELFSSANYVPVEKTATESNFVRLQDDDLDADVAELGTMSPDDSGAEEVYDRALANWFDVMPVIPTIQTTYTHNFNTKYWTGWPTEDDLYQVPNNWWGQFMFVIGSLKATGEQ